jgi:uncharacterized protein
MNKKHLVFSLLLTVWSFVPLAHAGLAEGKAALKAADYSAALREFKGLAEQGDPDAQFMLGALYYSGQGTKQDFAEAEKWIRKAAEQDFAYAQTSLGHLYEAGVVGVLTKSNVDAAQWYSKAAALQDAEGLLSLGLLYQQGAGVAQDSAQATKLIMQSAELGYAEAQLRLAMMYASGQGVAQSYDYSLKWLHKAAQQGSSDAQNNIGYMYDNGRGVTQDFKQAAIWYRKAAIQGNALAQRNLGLVYRDGMAMPANLVLAHAWLNLAAAGGYNSAVIERKELEQSLSNKEILQAQQLAAMWKLGKDLPEVKYYAKARVDLLPKTEELMTKLCSPAEDKGATCNSCGHKLENGAQQPYCYDQLSQQWKGKPTGC